MLSAIVLAAGSSKRMGSDNKLLLPYKGRTILETTISNILDADIKEVIVVTGFEADRITMAIQYLPVRIIYNTVYEKGMTTSIQKGVGAAHGNGFLICLADMLTITSHEYLQLANFFEQCYREDQACICVPRYKNEKGNPVIFAASYRDAILRHNDMEGCKAIVQSNKQHIKWIEMEADHVVADMDYPEDYKRLSVD